MTKKAFADLWSCLSNAFPSKISTDTRLFFLYGDEVAEIPDHNADKLLKAILKECEFFPKLARFSEICASFKERKPERTIPKNKDGCDYCLNSGLIMDTLHGNRTLGFICPKCDVGRALKKPYIRYYNEWYGDDGLEEVKAENIRFRNEIGDPKAYFFEKISRFGKRFETVDS